MIFLGIKNDKLKMKNLPLVSIIIPAYNMEAFLAETLDSILNSDYRNLEIIVMDDGSKDSTLSIAQEYARKDERVVAMKQDNAGACAARNHAIGLAKGELILPVDADNTIEPDFIGKAVEVLAENPDVKVVCSRADFMGERSGEWKLPRFDIRLLARKNMMDTCAMYRKEDWTRVGGYCNEIVTREDWDFWTAMLKDGGRVVKLKDIGFHYRIRGTSKRVKNRGKLKQTIDIMNRRHPEFYERHLGGRMRYRRSWSRIINRIHRFFHPRCVYVHPLYGHLKEFITVLPIHWEEGRIGKVIYQGRNELREIEKEGVRMVVKAFRKPNMVNRLVYGIFRPSKAKRSYLYAERLLKEGIGTPAPVAYYTERNGLLFNKSYYACLKSECSHTYTELMKGDYPGQEKILKAVAQLAARMHDRGFIHRDFSRGNILFEELPDGTVRTEVIDLNRIRFHHVGMEEGCRNFERLPGTPEMLRIMADEYARQRGFDPEACYRIISTHRE